MILDTNVVIISSLQVFDQSWWTFVFSFLHLWHKRDRYVSTFVTLFFLFSFRPKLLQMHQPPNSCDFYTLTKFVLVFFVLFIIILISLSALRPSSLHGIFYYVFRNISSDRSIVRLIDWLWDWSLIVVRGLLARFKIRVNGQLWSVIFQSRSVK